MNVENVGQSFALIIDESKPKSNLLLSIEPEEKNVITYLKELKLKDKQHFQLIPNDGVARDICYVTGASGSGKSYFTKQYADQYRKIYPKREIYLISSLSDDSSIDSIKNLRRIKLSPAFLGEDIQATDFKDSLVIFDDCEALTDKRMKVKVQSILNQLLTIGRHHNISVCNLTHSACNGSETKLILNESNTITIFPHGLGGRSLKYLLDQYLGLDKHQIKKLKKLKSRWVTIIKGYPMVVLSEKECYILNSNDDD
jgi:Cdc6-like AAA superfamily ATPase